MPERARKLTRIHQIFPLNSKRLDSAITGKNTAFSKEMAGMLVVVPHSTQLPERN
jgi:hypothetical protein